MTPVCPFTPQLTMGRPAVLLTLIVESVKRNISGSSTRAMRSPFATRRVATPSFESQVAAELHSGCHRPQTLLNGMSRLTQHVRHTQFRKTSEQLGAINAGKDATQKWVTKTTADYAALSNKATASVGAADADTQVREMMKQAEDSVARVKNFRKDRVGRYKYYFGQYGRGFLITYGFFYLVCLAAIYWSCRTRRMDKVQLFEFVFSLNLGSIDREAFFERVLQWDNYIDFGFAFLLNEMLDMWRLPFCMGIFWQFRKILARHQRHDSSIFRWQAPEASTYDPGVKRATAPGFVTGSSPASAAVAPPKN